MTILKVYPNSAERLSKRYCGGLRAVCFREILHRLKCRRPNTYVLTHILESIVTGLFLLTNRQVLHTHVTQERHTHQVILGFLQARAGQVIPVDTPSDRWFTVSDQPFSHNDSGRRKGGLFFTSVEMGEGKVACKQNVNQCDKIMPMSAVLLVNNKPAALNNQHHSPGHP